jgi:hypothetical protein
MEADITPFSTCRVFSQMNCKDSMLHLSSFQPPPLYLKLPFLSYVNSRSRWCFTSHRIRVLQTVTLTDWDLDFLIVRAYLFRLLRATCLFTMLSLFIIHFFAGQKTA